MRREALETVFDLAKVDSRVVFIGSDLGVGTLDEMKNKLPSQFFMEGISEQHLVGFASGLAKEGYIPYLNTIANFFSRRALEQLILDVALHNLPVKILASGGGMVYAPLGPTHTATDDLAHLLAIPNFNVYSPCDAVEMEEQIRQDKDKTSPAYFRFGKGGEEIVSPTLRVSNDSSFKFLGHATSRLAILTSGIALQNCLRAYEMIANSKDLELIHVTKVNFRKSEELLSHLTSKTHILVVEEHQEYGGVYTQLLHLLGTNKRLNCTLDSINLGNSFLRRYGSQNDHLAAAHIVPDGILSRLENLHG